jgi:hypothetical protein
MIRMKNTTISPVLMVESLKKLPAEIRKKLLEAAINLSTADMSEIIAELAEMFPEIATGLRELTEHFEFNQLIWLLEGRD